VNSGEKVPIGSSTACTDDPADLYFYAMLFFHAWNQVVGEGLD
jgi:hypothetical protein